MQRSVLDYYARLGERGRLVDDPIGRLEYLRTRELLTRLLPAAPVTVLDVGGATGVHAQWIAELGYAVHVVDPEPAQVAHAAQIPGVTAAVGDARALDQSDASVDVVLMLGPLYHLPDEGDRHRAWREAVRVVRPGGLIAAAAIQRHASLLDYASMGRLDDAALERIRRTLRTGRHDPALGFTDAYFHTSGELRDELDAAGLHGGSVLPIEGPGILAVRAVHRAGAVVSDDLLDSAIQLARIAESDPALGEVGSHLLAFGYRPA